MPDGEPPRCNGDWKLAGVSRNRRRSRVSELGVPRTEQRGLAALQLSFALSQAIRHSSRCMGGPGGEDREDFSTQGPFVPGPRTTRDRLVSVAGSDAASRRPDPPAGFHMVSFRGGFLRVRAGHEGRCRLGHIYPSNLESRTWIPAEEGEAKTGGYWPPTGGSLPEVFLGNRVPFVSSGEPLIMNKRLIAQSGTFIVPGVLDQPVEQILSTYPDPSRTVAKFVLRTERMRSDAMLALYTMNITNATLFPDLDGLARSLAYELEFHWSYDPKTMTSNPGYEY